jgi:hypothetical protein
MSSAEFARLVGVYGLPVPWLARHVGHVSERTFRYWVCGRPGAQVTVPDDAVQGMRALNAALNKTLQKK